MRISDRAPLRLRFPLLPLIQRRVRRGYPESPAHRRRALSGYTGKRRSLCFFDKLLTKIFGTSNERLIKKLWPVVATINDLEADVKSLTDEELRAKTADFKTQIAARLEGITGEEEIKAAEREALDAILPEAFAVVRRGGWRA